MPWWFWTITVNVEDPPRDIDLSETDDLRQIQAKLLCKQLDDMKKAKVFILNHLKTEPRLVTSFLFAPSRYDMKAINVSGININSDSATTLSGWEMPLSAIHIVNGSRISDSGTNLYLLWKKKWVWRQRG